MLWSDYKPVCELSISVAIDFLPQGQIHDILCGIG